MGGWDVFCAICGGPVAWSKPDEDEVNDELTEDEKECVDVLRNEKTDWVNQFRCLGEKPDCRSVDKVFVSGPAEYSDYGFCEVKPDKNENASADAYPENITVYAWGGRDNEPLAFPIHDICMDTLLQKAISSISAAAVVDNEVLFRTLKEFGTSSDENYAAYLDLLDYGEHMEDLHHQYWYLTSGAESYMVNPASIPGLEKYYSSLPLLRKQESGSSSAGTDMNGDNDDYFAKFPLELLQQILGYVPIDSVNALRATSPTVLSVTKTNSFWRGRLPQDMPWLYDLPTQNPQEEENGGQDVDWAQVYKDLLEKSQKNCQADSTILLGLVNRKRIWKLCEQIAASYIALKQAKDRKNNNADNNILSSALSGPMVRLGKLNGIKTETSKLALVSDLDEVGETDPVLSVYWSEEGYLLGFGVKSPAASQIETNHLGEKDKAARTDEVQIAKGDWLRGFIFTTRSELEYTYEDEEKLGRVVIGIELLFNNADPIQLGTNKGDKRLVQVSSSGEVLIGLLAEWTSTSGILRIALLKHQKKSAPLHDEVVNPYTNSKLDKILWKDELPPPNLDITSAMIGYWSYDLSVELSPHEAVIFGQNEAELSAITAVSIDVQFGAIEVHYSEGEQCCNKKKSYGPKPWAMKTLKIDGQGGERIVGAFADVNASPNGLRLVTNRNRQLVLGRNLGTGLQKILSASDTNVFCGLYCAWTGIATGQPQLDSLGTMSFPRLTPVVVDDDDDDEFEVSGLQDQNAMWWEPDAPPPTWKESGRLYGQFDCKTRWRTTVPKPSEYDIVSWLDMTRAVDEVKVTFTHEDRGYKTGMYLVSIILNYTDGTQASVGPDRFIESTDTKGESTDNTKDENGAGMMMPWCWCHLGDTDKSELASFAHYRHDQFKIEEGGGGGGGDFIDSIRIWTNPALSGFQFVTSAGVEGPKWGRCEGDAVAIIRFAHGDGDGSGSGSDNNSGSGDMQTDGEKRAVGLKVAMTDNERPTTYSDRIVAGFQALVRG